MPYGIMPIQFGKIPLRILIPGSVYGIEMVQRDTTDCLLW